MGGHDPAVVGLNEIHPTIAEELMCELRTHPDQPNVRIATSGTNSLLWRALGSLLTPQ